MEFGKFIKPTGINDARSPRAGSLGANYGFGMRRNLGFTVGRRRGGLKRTFKRMRANAMDGGDADRVRRDGAKLRRDRPCQIVPGAQKP